MKNIFLVLSILFNFAIVLYSVTISELWSVSSLDVPESVVYYPDKNVLFVSNINGDPTEKDKNGYISIIDLKGKIINKKWIATLDAPKGMAISNGFLYVADIDQLVVINIKNNMIVKRINIKSANFLNDVTADNVGNVYVSDSSSNPGIIYRYNGSKVEKWITSKEIKRPNGILFYDNSLYVGSFANGNLFKINVSNKSVIKLGHFINAIDGITLRDSSEIFLSNWFNKITYIKNLSTKIDFKISSNCADILFLKKENLLLVPAFFYNKLVAYKVSD